MHPTVRFSNQDKNAFFVTLTKRVNEYLASKKVARTGNFSMWFKTFAMWSMYLAPFILILTLDMPAWLDYLLCIPMGFGLAGIGLSVMHDANHDAYSMKPWINTLIGHSLDLVGGSSVAWKVQHNYLHHTYTNIFGMDEDIGDRKVLRMSRFSPWRPIHAFQWLYALPLYSLMTFSWTIQKDFSQMMMYHREGILEKLGYNPKVQYLKLIFFKLFYFGYAAALPIWLLDLTWYQWLLGYFITHAVAGFTLAVIFQCAHVIEETGTMPIPESGTTENSWAVHQMYTTANFSRNNPILNWYAGGLNFQIEHHLFPKICHVHYRGISPIVQQTAEEFGIPYYDEPSLFSALGSHLRVLKELGKRPEAVPAV